MGKKFYSVVGTEENMYEPEVVEFGNKRDAEKFNDRYERDCNKQGYETYIAGVAESEEERDALVAEVQQYRRDTILENFGEDVGEEG